MKLYLEMEAEYGSYGSRVTGRVAFKNIKSDLDRVHHELEEVPEDLNLDDACVVFIRYDSGDSFNNTRGHTLVVGVVGSEDEAIQICKELNTIKNDDYSGLDWSDIKVVVNGVDVFVGDAFGYFENSQYIDYVKVKKV